MVLRANGLHASYFSPELTHGDGSVIACHSPSCLIRSLHERFEWRKNAAFLF